MNGIYEYQIIVDQSALDGNQHVNNVTYVKWINEAAILHSESVGWSQQRYRQHQFGWVVRHHDITYLNPAFLHDELTVKTWIADMKRVSSLRQFRFYKHDQCILKAATNWVFIDFTTHKLKSIPESVSEAYCIVTNDCDA